MKFPMHSLTIRAAYTMLFGAAVAACGGGGSSEQQIKPLSSSGENTRTLASSSYIPQSRGTTNPTPASNNTAGPVTDVRFESTSNSAQTNVPVTFGQIFAPGHLTPGTSLVGRLDSGSTIPLQMDIKAKHADGSVRHAIISAILPSLGVGEVRTMSLARGSAVTPAPVAIASMLSSGFTASASATIAGVRYSASVDELMRKSKLSTWLSGSTAGEWEVSAPLTTNTGVEHPHLSARFAVRWYDTIKKARVEVVIENNWAYEPAPQNFTYDAEVTVGGKTVYTKPSLQHFHHARWRKLFWWNSSEPAVNVKHNSAYLIASRALPNYDQNLSIPESVLNNLKSRWTGTAIEPMGIGLTTPYMPQTGGRDDIGILPQWATVYLLSMDRRARDVTLGTAELAGSFSVHYRDKNTGQPVSLIDYPYMTLVGRPGDTFNPVTKRSEAFPVCATTISCKTPYTDDVPHQPGFAYLPYMLTGDHYFLEELQFWGTYNVFNSNPNYRENVKGLLKPEQTRGQAWGLRTLAEVAYITPDNDRLKAHFNRILDSNLDWYNENYTNNPNANKLGAITNGYAVSYLNGRALAPWMDDFFTAAVGHTHELGFTKATNLLKYKAKFPILRMIGDGACYVRGAMYIMVVRDNDVSPFYSTIEQAFAATDLHDYSASFTALQCGSAAMASVLGLKIGEMTGYSGAYAGYPSNMQPALAYAADIDDKNGAKAWDVFMSRSVKPNYAPGPQFDILPRQAK